MGRAGAVRAQRDGSLRLCTDFRALNKFTVKNRFPLPNIEELLDKLQGAKVFSSVDLAAGHHQIPIREEDRAKTAFFGLDGLNEYCVVPFGLSNAPAVFMDEITSALRGLSGKCCVVYLDDILVFSRTAEEHLELVLQRLRELVLLALATFSEGGMLTVLETTPDARILSTFTFKGRSRVACVGPASRCRFCFVRPRAGASAQVQARTPLRRRMSVSRHMPGVQRWQAAGHAAGHALNRLSSSPDYTMIQTNMSSDLTRRAPACSAAHALTTRAAAAPSDPPGGRWSPTPRSSWS